MCVEAKDAPNVPRAVVLLLKYARFAKRVYRATVVTLRAGRQRLTALTLFLWNYNLNKPRRTRIPCNRQSRRVQRVASQRRPVRSVAFNIVLKGLPPLHQVEQLLPINDAFGVTIGRHISGIAPLYRPQYTKTEQFPDPHDVAQETLLSWCFEVCAAQALVDALGIDCDVRINLKTTILPDVLKLLCRQHSVLKLVQRDQCRVRFIDRLSGC